MRSWAHAARRIERLEGLRKELIADGRADLVPELDFLIEQERTLQGKLLFVASSPVALS